MKKLFTLCLGLMAALAVQAQSDFPVQFADKDGNVIADGTTLTLNEIVATDFGDIQVPTHLFAKNTTGESVQVGGIYNIQTINNGTFQTCFPVNCIPRKTVGQYETGDGPLAANELKDMLTEWFPTGEGECTVVYQLITYKQNAVTKKWNKDKSGPTVTLKFSYLPSGIAQRQASKAVSRVVYYDITGRPVSQPLHGVYVRKTTYADGSVKVNKVRK